MKADFCKAAAKKLLAVILVLSLSIASGVISVHGYQKLPAPDWVTVSANQDYTKTVTIKTPAYMLEHIDYYEYSTDGFITKSMLSKTGGEFVFDTTTEFSLRYVRYDVESEIFTVTVDINKITIITSDSVNITVLIPFGSAVHTDITLSAYEIVSGTVTELISNKLGEGSEFRIYNTAITRNGKPYTLPENIYYMFPCEGYDSRFCKLYHIDSKGNMTLIESAQEMTMRLTSTMLTGMFAVVQDKRYRPGDVNGDTEITAVDARLALRFSAKLEKPSEKQLISADLNNNSAIDAAEARKILRAAAKLEKL